MKKYLIAAVGSLALVLAGISYAAEQEAPKGDAKPQQETKKDAGKTKSASTDSKKSATKKCAEGQVYSKQDKKCVAKSAGAGTGTAKATAPAAPKY
jgi:predicted lipid-binding transport protein (Tim44 family)